MDKENKAGWEYKPDDQAGPKYDPGPNKATPDVPPTATGSTFSWTASEYVEHDHSTGWYVVLLAATAVVGAAVFLLTKDYFATAVIGVVGILVAVFAGHKPRQVTYEISSSGLRAGDKSYPYSQFKSFAIVREGGLASINLEPLKRFAPPISAYFAPADEERITNALGQHLPYEERKADSVSRLSHRLRF